MSSTAEFREVVTKLEGMTCTEVQGGFGVGSMIWLYFGNLFCTTVHLKDGGSITVPDAAVSVDILFAAWRIETTTEIICASTSSNHIGGPIDRGLALIRGKRLESTKLTEPSLDLQLIFEHGVRLLIFCDQWNDEDPQANYEIQFNGKLYEVGCKSILTFSAVTIKSRT